jgi:hypothetical protein
MPILDQPLAATATRWASQVRRGTALFPICTSSECASSWLHIWRNRNVPMIEGGWVCSAGCTRARIDEIFRREHEGHTRTVAIHVHRIPIGLVLLREGWISHGELKKGLEAQKAGTADRIGSWLMQHCGLEESRVTQALSIQWNCPIFSRNSGEAAQNLSFIPRMLLDTFNFLPMRLSTTGILYIAFEDRIDHSLTLAIERMTGLRVEAGLMNGSEFRRAHDCMLAAKFPRARLIEAVDLHAMANTLTRLVEKEKPAEARLVRVHGFYWFRLWKETGPSASNVDRSSLGAVEDVICSLAQFQ